MRNLLLSSRRPRTSCSVLALATVLVVGATPAFGQSFLGSGSFTHNGGGSAAITTAPNLTTITVNPGSTVIDWTPTDTGTGGGSINFQPAGTTANFLGSSGFAVLNRINPADSARSISMNGTIQTLALGGTAAVDGRLYFYTPGGFVIGSNAVINVGSLVLSASPISVDGNGNFISGPSNTVAFGQASQTGARINVASGAQINALANTGSYVAMVAPSIVHNGTIDVGGSVALVAAEAATINFSPDGLFDIQVTSGTSSTFGISTAGSIGGAASSGAGDNHRIHLVAIPKNQALTMVIGAGADLGFDVAGAANVEGNTIVLSAGHDIVDGTIGGVSAASTTGAVANLDVRDSNFTSAVIGDATGFAHFAAFSALNFRSDVTAHADGEIWFSTQTATGTIDVDGDLTLSTERFGANGQAVTASLIDIYNLNGAGRITVDGLTSLDTDAYGGDSIVPGINGGNAVAGEIDIVANGGGTIELLGGLIASADGHGGTALVAGADGGSGTGGDISIRTGSTNGIVRVIGATDLSSSGYGGSGNGGECFACDGDGGAGQGGEIRIYTGDATGSSLTITGAVDARADGFGGSASFSPTAIAGAGTGGVAAYYVGTAGVMTLTGNLSLQASGQGGAHSAANAGSGFGGLAVVSETVGATSGTMTINGNVELSSDGTGGDSSGNGARGGDGFGGIGTTGSSIVAVAATTTINGTVDMHSTGTGGNAVNGTGGTGRGGEARIRSLNFLRISGGLTATAQSTGGQGAIGGQAEGGHILVRALAGGDLQLLGATNLLSNNATGGTGTNGNGGNASSNGDIRFFAEGIGSTIVASGAITVSSDSLGGNGSGGAGGSARGGAIDIYAHSGGSLTFDDDLTVSASATGGSTASGIGGDALGGIARVRANAGTVSIGGDLMLDGGAIGGTGGSGGNATALVSPQSNEGSPVAVALQANNGGSITVDGQAILNASAVGGAGASGNGGNAVGGEVDVVPFVGDISLGGLSIDVTARGGNGGNGGNGGSGQGGAVDVTFGLDNATVSGTINLGSVAISANGYGGSGGAGSNATVGGDGGAGGAGLGGSMLVAGGAAGGMLETADVVLTAIGIGGRGGTGGNGVSGAGGDGGSGGNATGGVIQTGTISQSGSPGSGGGADFANLSINTSAIGGAGGNGGSGGGGTGAGGGGGDAIGGRSSFLIRGVLGTADSVTLLSNATGGNGGSGTIAGVGGDARTGTILVESKDRFEVPTERGSLIVGAIVGTAIATGGSGATAGTSTVTDGSSFRLLNGDATIGSLAITLSGDLIDSTLGPSFVSVRDGAASIASFSFVTGGTLSLDADNGAMNAGSMALEAGNFVPHIANPSPTALGTFFANSFDISTGNNFVTTAHLDSVGALSIVAPGAIQIGNVTSDAGIVFEAQGAEIDIGNVLAGGGVDLDADDFVTTGNVVANGLVEVDTGTTIGMGSIDNSGNTSLSAGVSIDVGAIDSGAGAVTLITGSSSIEGDSVTGGSIFADSGGDLFLGDLTASDDIELVAAGDLMIGSAASGESIDLDAGGYIDGGNMTAGDSVYARAGGSIDLLNVSAGIVEQSSGYEADYNVGLLAGTTIDTGNISAFNSVGLDAGGDITTGNINAGTFIETLSGGSQALANLTAGDWIELDSEGGITFAAVNGESFDFTAGGAVNGGNITAQTFAIGEAEGAILLGNVTTTQASPIDDFSIGFASATSITIGNVVGVDEVGFATFGNLTAGNITAGNLFMALVGGDMTTGSITTASSGQVYIGDASMFITGGGGAAGEGEFDPAIVLALAPVSTGGSITFNGAVTTGRVQAAAGDNLSTRAITASQIQASAGDLATLDGIWRSGDVSLRSGDIAITANGGIDAGSEGTILLNAVRTDGSALIGDGLTGTGYALSNAEFGRISGGLIRIAVGGFGGDADTLIGDLTITGPLAGSNIESSDGGVEFITLQEDGAALDGTLRIVGDVVATGFGTENYLGFYTQNFELDAATGSISITGNGTQLAGIMELYASRIHVAEGTLLDQLAINPQFVGYREALNQPAATARPGGVINAASFDIEFGGSDSTGPYTLYVQNMGTATVPAGFLLNAANIADDEDDALAAGSVDLAINGQIITGSGTITGVAVRDLLVTEFGTTAFAAGSTINGCPLTGTCSATPPRVDTPTRTDVPLSGGDGLGDGLFGNESDIDDGESGDEGDVSSPIEAPVPLFDSRPLAGSSDVDDPVSGAGNPSLIDTSDDEQVCDPGTGQCETIQKGDGK